MLHLMFAAEAADAGNPILPTVPQLFWGAISFAALYTLVRFVLLPPTLRVMNDREATIQADRDAAEKAKAKVASAGSELADQLADVRAEADSIIEAARAEAETESQRLNTRAERDVAAMQEVAAAEIAREREEAMAAVRPQVAELAVGAASKVMNRQISLDSARSVVNRELDSPN